MLVLTRKVGERVWIGDDIAVTIVKLAGGGVRLGIEAPPKYVVVRDELKARTSSSDEPPSAAGHDARNAASR
jgi:carbon storage regulator